MSKRSVTKLSSFFNSDQYTEDLSKMDDILEMVVTIHGVSWRKGQTGEYAVMTVVIDETGAEIKVSCGGIAICDALRAAEQQRAFPFQAKVSQKGRMYLFVDPE